MKLNTNIVLKGNKGRSQSYMVQLTPKTPYIDNFVFSRCGSENYAVVYKESSNPQLIKDGNDWYEEVITGTEYQLHKANIRIYFPQFSVDTFENGATYILTLSTYIRGIEVKLGNFKFRRSDALACVPIRFDGMDEYYEYLDFEIADPYSIHYEDEGQGIRESLGEYDSVNENGSLLYVCLYPVEESENNYILRSDWGSGQNSLLLSENTDLNLHIDYLPDSNSIQLTLNYNGKGEMSIAEYINEVYGTDTVTVLWEYVVMDDDNIYFQEETKDYIIMQSFDESFDYSFTAGNSTPGENEVSFNDVFKSWDDWKEGLYIKGSISFLIESEGDDPIPYMTVISNKMPITEELFAMLIREEGIPMKIDLDSLDMNNVTLTAINKIEEYVTAVTPNDSTKSHLIQPVFYQTRTLNSIVIHPSVTENIAINLDSYKSQVERFELQIEGVVFNEIGRTSKGIVFKVYGNMLPKMVNKGVMYILDQNGDLVTTGKYSYVY